MTTSGLINNAKSEIKGDDMITRSVHKSVILYLFCGLLFLVTLCSIRVKIKRVCQSIWGRCSMTESKDK